MATSDENIKNKPKNTLKKEVEEKPKNGAKKKTPTEKKEKTEGGRFTFFTNFLVLVRSERFKKVSGLFLIVLSIYLAISFLSYFFHWKYDQSLVQSYANLLDERPRNVMGSLGARLAHLFIYQWFGISSFLLIPLFFLMGVRMLYKTTLWNLSRAIGILGFLTVWISGVFGLLFSSFFGGILGGKFGFQLSTMIGDFAGTIGTGIIYIFSFLVFLIVAYNYSLKWNFRKNTPAALAVDEEEEEVQHNFHEEAMCTDFYTHRQEIEEEDLENLELEVTEKIPEVVDELPVLEDEIVEEFDEPLIFEPEEETEFEMPIQNNTNTNPIESDTDFEIEVHQPEVFVPEKDENQSLAERLVAEHGEYDPLSDLPTYKIPTIDLLEDYGTGEIKINKEELEQNKNRIVETLNNYGINIAKIKATVGPTVTLYEIVPEAGVRISKIKNLEDDIALSLAALGIRIIAPIPGKGTIGIEVPNQSPEIVSMASVLNSDKFSNSKFDLPVCLGKTISNEIFVADLAKMPHLLMAGATGQGKSVGLNAILVSLLYKKHPAEIKFVMVDPKKVELTLYNLIEKHFLAKLPGEEEAIITDTQKVVHTLNSLTIEMDARYELLKDAQVRNIKEYNAKFRSRKLNPAKGHRFLPYIVLVVDEFADLIMTAGKEVEKPIARLAQLARAIGIHLIIATQRPSVNIITGTIKANFPARIAFRVTSKIDSRTILDAGGAEQLIGRGDMLLSTGSELLRLQCPFVDTPEVERIAQFIANQRGYVTALELPEPDLPETSDKVLLEGDRDALFEEAALIIVQNQQGSTSLLQRRLNLGYNRAGRLMDQLEAAGVVGPNAGSKARQVLINDEMHLRQHLDNLK